MTVVLKLDRERVLRFNPATAIKFKKAYGKPLLDVMLKRGDAMPEVAADPDAMLHALWAGLTMDDDRLTVSKTLDLLNALFERDKAAMRNVLDALADAMKESGMFGEFEDDEPGKAPTGTETP